MVLSLVRNCCIYPAIAVKHVVVVCGVVFVKKNGRCVATLPKKTLHYIDYQFDWQLTNQRVFVIHIDSETNLQCFNSSSGFFNLAGGFFTRPVAFLTSVIFNAWLF